MLLSLKVLKNVEVLTLKGITQEINLDYASIGEHNMLDLKLDSRNFSSNRKFELDVQCLGRRKSCESTIKVENDIIIDMQTI